MRFSPARCPHCRANWVSTDELIAATSSMTRNADGTYDYDGNTEVCWDAQETCEDDFGRVTAQCENGHNVEIRMYDDDEKRPRGKVVVTPGTKTALLQLLARIVNAADGTAEPEDGYVMMRAELIEEARKQLPKKPATNREAIQQMSTQP